MLLTLSVYTYFCVSSLSRYSKLCIILATWKNNHDSIHSLWTIFPRNANMMELSNYVPWHSNFRNVNERFAAKKSQSCLWNPLFKASRNDSSSQTALGLQTSSVGSWIHFVRLARLPPVVSRFLVRIRWDASLLPFGGFYPAFLLASPRLEQVSEMLLSLAFLAFFPTSLLAPPRFNRVIEMLPSRFSSTR